MDSFGNAYYDKAGKDVMSSYERDYYQPDVIWEHPTTGGKVFVGSASHAADAFNLKDKKLFHIVNTQGTTSENYQEHDPDFTYLRFPIGAHYQSPMDMNTNEGVMRYFSPYF